MAQITMDDPDVYRDGVPVDDRGRIVVGKQYAGTKVRVAMEVVDE